LRLFLK